MSASRCVCRGQCRVALLVKRLQARFNTEIWESNVFSPVRLARQPSGISSQSSARCSMSPSRRGQLDLRLRLHHAVPVPHAGRYGHVSRSIMRPPRPCVRQRSIYRNRHYLGMVRARPAPLGCLVDGRRDRASHASDVLYGAYKAPREVMWMVGVLLFLLVMTFAFTGYLLPWDQTAYWATQIGINMVGTRPADRRCGLSRPARR